MTLARLPPPQVRALLADAVCQQAAGTSSRVVANARNAHGEAALHLCANAGTPAHAEVSACGQARLTVRGSS